jgi:hypothetical protein
MSIASICGELQLVFLTARAYLYTLVFLKRKLFELGVSKRFHFIVSLLFFLAVPATNRAQVRACRGSCHPSKKKNLMSNHSYKRIFPTKGIRLRAKGAKPSSFAWQRRPPPLSRCEYLIPDSRIRAFFHQASAENMEGGGQRKRKRQVMSSRCGPIPPPPAILLGWYGFLVSAYDFDFHSICSTFIRYFALEFYSLL